GDRGVPQAAVDLGLQHEAGTEVGLGDLVGADLLEGHLAAELLIVRDVNPAQAALFVKPQDAEPPAGSAGRSSARSHRLGVVTRPATARGGRRQAGLAGAGVE